MRSPSRTPTSRGRPLRCSSLRISPRIRAGTIPPGDLVQSRGLAGPLAQLLRVVLPLLRQDPVDEHSHRRSRPAGRSGRPGHLAPQLPDPADPGRQAPGRRECLGILRHGQPAARAQVRVRVQALAARLGCELAGRSAGRPRDPRSTQPPSRVSRTQEPGERLRRVRGGHHPGRQADGQRRSPLRLPAGQEPSLGGSRQSPLSGDPPGRAVRRRLELSHHLAADPAAGGGDVRSGRRPDAAARLLCPVRQRARQRHDRLDQRFSGNRRARLRLERRERERPRRTRRDRPRSGSPVRWRASIRTIPPPPIQINQIAADYKTPTTDEIIVGVERQFTPDLSGSLAYTYRSLPKPRFTPLIGTTRASYQYVGNATGTAVDPATGFVLNFSEPYYALTECPDPASARVLENRQDASETYSGFELQLLKSFSHGWMARVSFGYNDWQQHIGRARSSIRTTMPPGTNASGPVVAGNINAHLAVQRQRHGRASPGNRGRREPLRSPGLPHSLHRGRGHRSI